jgi:hypothetical protein
MDTMVFRNEFEQVSALALADMTHEMQCCLYEMPAMANLCSGNFLTIGETAWAMAIAFETGRRVRLFEAAAAISNPASINELGEEPADWHRLLWKGQSRISTRVSSQFGNPEAILSQALRKPNAARAHTVLVLAKGGSFV